jgi:flagellar motor switch protein FliN/FliY
MTATQFTWLPRLERACVAATVVPMAGGLPPFPERTVVEALQKVLALPELQLELSLPTFLEANEGADLAYQLEQSRAKQLTLHVQAAPLHGTASLVVDQQVLWSLLHASLGQPITELVPLVDDEINHGFGAFVLLAVLHTLQQVGFPPGTRYTVVDHAEGPPALTFDLVLKRGNELWPARILCTEALLNDLRKAAAERPLQSLNPALAALMDVPVDVPVGRVELPWGQVHSLKSGDVVILDQLDLDLATGEGSVLLRVGAQDVWSCRLSGGQLTAEQPFPAHAEDRAMSFTPGPEDELFGELDEIGSFEDLEVEDLEPAEPKKKRKKTSEEHVPAAKHGQGGIADKVHVNLTVSLGRMTLTAHELFEIKPGNVLNLPIQTSGQVDLLVGADLVGRGELIQLGDALGVRIVEL